jgi:hypothetical protein
MVSEASKAAETADKISSGKRGQLLARPGSIVLASAGPPWCVDPFVYQGLC